MDWLQNFCNFLVCSLLTANLSTITAAATASPSTTEKKLRNYGDKCDRSNPSMLCNSQLNLVCGGKDCICKESYYKYDKNFNKCVGVTGVPCNPHTVVPQCLTNSTCRSSYFHKEFDLPKSLVKLNRQTYHEPEEFTCQCNGELSTNFFRQHAAQCRVTWTIEQNCTRDYRVGKCDETQGLFCGNSKTCACRNNKMTFSKEVNRCVKRLGSTCSLDDSPNPCPYNSLCSGKLLYMKYQLERKQGKHPPHPDDRELVFGRCVCAPGFSPNAAGTACMANAQVECSKSSDCNADSFLTCVDGICQCERPLSMTFSTNEEKCKIRVGYTCSEKAGAPCVENSICRKGTCECKDGLIKAGDGRCVLGHGSSCSIPSGSNTATIECNNLEGLACVESKCDCFDSVLKWNPKTKMCVAKGGKRCGEIRAAHNSGEEKDVLYPFATSSVNSYFVGCEDGFRCTQDPMEDLYHCQKLK